MTCLDCGKYSECQIKINRDEICAFFTAKGCVQCVYRCKKDKECEMWKKG